VYNKKMGQKNPMSTIYFAKSYKKIFFLVYNKKMGQKNPMFKCLNQKKKEI